MDPSCLVTTVKAGGDDVMVWGMFSWLPLVPIGNRVNATAYLSIVSDHVHPSGKMNVYIKWVIYSEEM